MRLLLIANAKAQTVTPAKIRFITRALGSRAEVRFARTRASGHGTELAAAAARDGADAVAVLGGDGTVNEAVNALATTGVPLGIIPGGGTNVFARSIGIPQDAVRAAGHLMARLTAPPRTVSLGRARGRYFTFACGMGVDGEIVRRVERRQSLKRAGGHGYFVWSALRVGLFDYDLRAPRITATWGEGPGERRAGLALAICQNGSPFTYLLGRPMRICPRADLEAGLDLFATRPIGRLRVVRLALQAFGPGRHTRDRRALSLHDHERIRLTADEPLAVQMDGEYVGRLDDLVLESAPGALRLLA